MRRIFVSTSVFAALIFMGGCSNDGETNADNITKKTSSTPSISSSVSADSAEGGISYDEAQKNGSLTANGDGRLKDVKTTKNGTDLEITVNVQNVSSQDAIYDVVIVSGGKDVVTESVSVVANSSGPANFYVPNYEKLLDVKNVSLALRTSEIAGDVDSISITDKI